MSFDMSRMMSRRLDMSRMMSRRHLSASCSFVSAGIFFRRPAPPLWCWCLPLQFFVLAHQPANADLRMGVAGVELVGLGRPVHVFFELFAGPCVYLPPLRIDFARK